MPTGAIRGVDVHAVLGEASGDRFDVLRSALVRADDRVGQYPAAVYAKAVAAHVLGRADALRDRERERRGPRSEMTREPRGELHDGCPDCVESVVGEVQDRRVAALEPERMVGDLEAERDAITVESRSERRDQRGAAGAGHVPIDPHADPIGWRVADREPEPR